MPSVRNLYRSVNKRTFDGTLRTLKRQGCTLLITGAVSERVTAKATKRLLGDPHRDRKRLLVFTDASPAHIETSLLPGIRRTDSSVKIIQSCGNDRGNLSATDEEHPSSTDGESKLDCLRGELAQAVNYFDEVADGLGRAELRVSIDSLEQLLEAYDRPVTKQFLRATTALVRGVHGIQHVHLPMPDESPVVQELSPLFDARIELRKRGTLVAEQRWHVPQHDITTAWSQL